MKPSDPTDEKLISGCRENNRICQELLYRRYARDMFNLCLIYEHDRDRAKDILQDAFIKIFKNIDRCDGKSSLKSWMRSVICNTAIDQYRRKNREYDFISIDKIKPPCTENDPVVSDMNTEEIISQVNRLPAGARMIFKLFVIEGYSHKEISKLLHISEGTCKSQINRAKQLLRQWIGNYDLTHKVIGAKR